jgi:hypothetical protein
MKCFVALVAGVTLIAGGVLIDRSTPTSAQEASTPSPQASPDAVLEAPANVQFDLGSGRVSWSDNSSGEDGFRVRIATLGLAGEELYSENHTTGPNVNSVQATSVERINAGELVRVSVVAFNASGDSAPESLAVSLEGGLVPSTTVTIAPQLPRTGYGDHARDATRGSYGILVAFAAFGGLALHFGSVMASRAAAHS